MLETGVDVHHSENQLTRKVGYFVNQDVERKSDNNPVDDG